MTRRKAPSLESWIPAHRAKRAAKEAAALAMEAKMTPRDRAIHAHYRALDNTLDDISVDNRVAMRKEEARIVASYAAAASLAARDLARIGITEVELRAFLATNVIAPRDAAINANRDKYNAQLAKDSEAARVASCRAGEVASHVAPRGST